MTTASTTQSRTNLLAAHFAKVRTFTERICEPLSAEDCVIQSMPDVSPTRWHLAHTSWFFETFILAKQPGYQVFDDRFSYLFNSYYESLGRQFPRPQRGLLSRPNVATIYEYRSYVDRHMARLLQQDELPESILSAIEIGLHHEQQHQELILTDIKHVLFCNPIYPAYDETGHLEKSPAVPVDWIPFDGGIHSLGHEGPGFAYDNECPRHDVLLEGFEIQSRPVTCGEYLKFMVDQGYERPEMWLSLGRQFVLEQDWRAPLYWIERDGKWYEFTLARLQELDEDRPVCHLSYFEADAYARWAGARLPTEAEWEVVAQSLAIEGRFADVLVEGGNAIHPGSDSADSYGLNMMFGNVWEWTSSPYAPYPRYQPPRGALGEYNGKFMCNQYVLRGGSCATSRTHMRATYRNFMPPEARWQFSGVRLARSSS